MNFDQTSRKSSVKGGNDEQEIYHNANLFVSVWGVHYDLFVDLYPRIFGSFCI